ncbi:uncharacterized protein LOC102801427 [Saccoglossus kowalevskii]|uniref:Uncharacterized protein LOC102801427 n=1 Tax=Saccoglossus kowalevskii TaxID=10224 RepID=A0ABM0MU63_SACKO|nr:PREDICTED: uncharacterized protein LOC102801427 [Saccoglossus kowalevskii]
MSCPPCCKFETDCEPPTKKTRFVSLTGDQLDEIEGLKDEKNRKNQTGWGIRIMKDWLRSTGKNPEFEHLSVEDLNNVLRQFYAEMRSQAGEKYGRSSLGAVRAAINRLINSPPYNRNLNIMQDREFNTANKTFKGLIKQLKIEGLDKVEHKIAICRDDLKKLVDTQRAIDK